MMKIIDLCEKYDMLPKGATVLAAVSGGKDSMCLLELLLCFSEQYGLNIACAHFDHQLRGECSLRDRRFVENYCKERGIPCYTGTSDVSAYAAENGIGIEEAARTLRYEFLEKTADEIGADRIATAHTANDNTETFLFNFARGSGLTGLCGIPPVRGRIVRPLLHTTTDEVLSYLQENGIPHVEDATNDEDFCARNKIRHKVIPVLRDICGGFDENAVRGISLLREDDEYLYSIAQRFTDEKFDGDSLPSAEFAELPHPISARVLKIILGAGISAGHTEAIREIAEGGDPHASVDIPGMRVFRDYDRLVFGDQEQEEFLPRVVRIGSSTEIPEAGLKIYCEFIPQCGEIYNSFNNFYFKSDSVCGKIIVRPRFEGGTVRLAGRNCTKSLKKLFSEAKLNGKGRYLVPVLCDGAGVIAVYGFGIAERCLPHPGDDVIHIRIEK